MNNPILSIENISFSYNQHNILNDINIEIEKGGIYGLIGPNGVGKTTLIKLMTGLLSCNNGHIKYWGNHFQQNKIEILNRIGVSIEYPSLYFHLNAYDNVKIYATYYGLNENKIEKTLKLVNLWSKRTVKVRKFSMGMKQKLALAITLIHNPEFIILDEPTNGLDPNANLEMIQLLKNLPLTRQLMKTRYLNKLSIISSHILENGTLLNYQL